MECSQFRNRYNTDLTDIQWSLLERLLPPPKQTGRKPTDRRWLLDAILYLNRTGCQWHTLPHDFSKWKTVYNNFGNGGTRKRVHDALVRQVWLAKGKVPTPSAIIIDSSSVTTTEIGGVQGVTTLERMPLTKAQRIQRN